MASQCKRQQCTIDRRGFRQELDSWRHKLIHCVGFESILDGLFGPELVQDLQLFKDFEPTTVSDWSFDENCLFCCLRRDKVKEHLIGLSHEGLDDTPKPLQVRDQTNISRLEKQAEEFLHAVLSRKDVPNFSDPHIPVVAREILQRMIKQFAAEYTSKTSSSQDSCSDSQPLSDQSLPTPPLISAAPPSTSPALTLAGPAHNQNPVLSKLLMADQDAPLDLTIKKPLAVPSDQADGVLDLSIKKNRYSSILPVKSPCLSPAVTTIKGESSDFCVSKTKELQSSSTLEQFMAKLCPHHQRQIVDAIGYLQTEVKALESSSSQQDSIFTSGIKGTACSTPKSHAVNSEKSELRFPSQSTPKTEVQDASYSILSSWEKKNVPDISLKTSATGPALDLRSSGLGSNQALATTNANQVDAENNRHGDHAPLKLKIMTSNAAAGKRLSCVLNASFSSLSDTLEEGEVNSYSSSRTETHSARLSSSMKRHSQASSTHQVRQKELQHAKDSPTKLFSVHMTIPPDSPRTARKTMRASSDHRFRDSAFRGIVDPDLGHCDIVFIDKPITECFKERQRKMVPRRNARKSTRGHMFSDEIWELKTVRTLARRGNCPNPMPELNTLVTPKQILSKPDGVPPVDMPFAGACRETMIQQMSGEQSDESVIPGTGDTVEVVAREVDTVVETSQTDQSQSKGQSVPPSPTRPPTESQEADLNTDAETYISADSGKTTGIEENCDQVPSEPGKKEKSEPRKEICESTEQIVAETVLEPIENSILEEAESQPSSEELLNSEPILEQSSSTPKPANLEEKTVTEESTMETVEEEDPQEMQPATQTHNDNSDVREQSIITGSTKELMTKESEIKTSEAVDRVLPSEREDGHDEEEGCDDLSNKTLDALLKELPPWRRKKGTVISPPKLQPKETVVVGYVNGRPVSASDRSLRRKSSSNAILNRVTSKRSLRTNQMPAESQVSPPTSVSSISPTKSAATHSAPSAEHIPTLPLPPSLSATAPQVISSLSAATEQSQHSAVQETTVELNTEKTQPIETTSEEIQTDVENKLQAKQKPSSTQAGADDIKNEKQQPSSEESSPLENQSPEKTDTQSQNVQPRGKRVHRTEVESLLLEPSVASLVHRPAIEDSSSFVSDKPTRMPLRSEKSKVGMSHQSVTQSPVDNKKSALRSQRLASPTAPPVTAAGRQSEVASPVRIIPERITKAQVKSPPASTSSALPHSSANLAVTPRREPPKQTNKFLETLTGEENQHLVTNLNHKYDKMQRGWVQMDKEGQPVIKYKNKADRQAAIWKSKRRAKKSKSLEHQKYSPVQMLFMKGFNLTSICRWFLDSTETKSLVIVKKVNTRLPSETQLCFHSSSSAGTSQGVFPSLQAERLKKHLKKFAIASPVKSNPRSQKLIAKALEQEGIAVKGKERRELLSTTQTIIKSLSSAEASAQKGETHKSSGKSKNPASARILRKYSNIREKMQVQQTNVRLNKSSKTIKTSSLKRLGNTKSAAKSILKPSLKAQKSSLPASKQTREPAAKLQKSKTLADKKTTKQPVQNKVVKAQSSVKASRDTTRKELPKRSSLRLGSPKKPEQNPVETSKGKVDGKKEVKAEKVDVEKPAVNKMNAARIPPKESKSPVAEIKSTEVAVETPQQSVVPASPDQVLTRSQRKMETVVSVSGSTSPALKRTTKSTKTQNASPKPDGKADEPALTRSGALRAPTKKGRPASLPKSLVKAPAKRAQQLPETPAKRTRTSLAK